MTQVYEKLQAVEFDKLPEAVRKVYLAPPLLSVPVEPDGEGFKLASPEALDRPAPQALVPKLGIKSWREAGALGVVYEGVNILSVVDLLLKRPTLPQRLAAQAWLKAGLPLRLHLSAYMDFSGLSEVRFLADHRQCRRVSACLREPSAQGLRTAFPRMEALAKAVASQLPPRSHIIDIAVLASGEISLVEVNPGLTPQDLAVLRAV